MESINISFTVTGQDLMGDCPFLCASNTVSYIIAEFDLDDNWKEFDSVRAVWRTDSECISTVLDNNGNCNVPQEVLKRKNEVIVNLVGSVVEDNELTERLTTYPVVALIVDATALICGTETAEVTPSQFEQYIAQVIAEVEKVTGMTAVAVPLPEGSDPTASYEDGVLTLGIPKGEKGDTGNGIERVEFNSDYSLTF
ncbi:MAG: Hsp20/alpha crystallin family protein, partial [Bacteroidales bacterium]|nr:Hsp20/alpha crystallin family protein [Bacteroidales bacterium]